MKTITTRSGVAYEGLSIPTNPSPKKVVERETEEDKTLPKPNIPYPSRCNDQKSRDKALNQIEKIFQIFQDLRFDISFADALLLMPRFAPMIKSLLMNKEKLLELAKIPLNENCSAMLLKKLGDPDKFLIPYRSITRPKGVVEDVFVKVGSFHFPTDFVVVDFEADPRVPLILGRSFLRTSRALIDVYEGELILRDGDERLIFHVDKHPQKHAKESIKMINFIEDSFGEVLRLKKSNHFLSGSTTPLSDSSPSLTSFETSDSLLEEFADELALLDPFPPGNEDVDVEAELREIKLLFNCDPSTNFSPRITFDPNPERFTNEPSLVCLPLPRDECECNVPDSQTINFLTFSNPLFNDSASSNDESSHEEVTHKMSFITYSNPLFNLDEEIISSKFNPIHNEVLNSIPKNDHFDAKSYLHESPLNHDTLIVFSPRNDPLHHEFAGEIITPPPRIDSDSHREEIDIFPGPDDLMPLDIEEGYYDSEDDKNSTVDEPVLLHTPFPDEDECFDP
ncbi:reverse transcriptase domain-containing protein [Tanacetum coccineum]|uniref:Reverse transcriptase domain-containing protein n=1 Tax=Tanacetum coccineum TaxID=301880 RepID=A0ABQ4ZKF4_9ASTR